MTHQYCKILITDVYIERFFELKEAVSKFTIEVNEPQTRDVYTNKLVYTSLHKHIRSHSMNKSIVKFVIQTGIGLPVLIRACQQI